MRRQKMKRLSDKKIKELILSGKHLKQSEFDIIKNRSEEFKNIVFRKVNNAQCNCNADTFDNIRLQYQQIGRALIISGDSMSFHFPLKDNAYQLRTKKRGS